MVTIWWDDTQQVLFFKYDDQWTWSELHAAFKQVDTLVPEKVQIIICILDMRDFAMTQTTIYMFIKECRSLLTNYRSYWNRLRVTYVVGTNKQFEILKLFNLIYQHIIQIHHLLDPQMPWYFVDSIEEAERQAAEKWRELSSS